MSYQREVRRVIAAVDSTDGAGVKLKRSVGRNPSSRIDPFLMLDAFSSDDPDDYIAGFPPHPHRGFETVTYMLDGHMIHRDHMGNEGDLRSGGVQWMTAGRGVIHEERPQQVDGLMRGFQLWINLPSSEKMQPAAYQNIEPEQVPSVMGTGYEIKVIAGQLEIDGHVTEGPVQTSSTEASYFDLLLTSDSQVSIPLNKHHSVVVYVFEGSVAIGNDKVETHSAVELSPGDEVQVKSLNNVSARVLLLSGRPINEPVAQYGPFVMNTMEEVEQAISDYQENRLVG
ncbi:pirin family protein [Neptuniibacter caesariensis]|uniref:Pirin-like n=1 Tax=Neptuniibacter caesariensis TaxID=207954 RepID=A0A7U8C6Z2_NEPCE|nr:pirin family protein [Neptuniibacter caesariensis]EAR61024.1 Pirin-like [Neptuniibacter caesariensis]